jgi:hypothetical protein
MGGYNGEGVGMRRIAQCRSRDAPTKWLGESGRGFTLRPVAVPPLLRFPLNDGRIRTDFVWTKRRRQPERRGGIQAAARSLGGKRERIAAAEYRVH